MNIWIVTEYCSQGDLVKYLRSQGNAVVGSAEQLRFSLQVCAAMRFLEAQRIVHRDLAARNVLLDDEAHCKLSDFGLARRLRRDGTIVPAGDGFLTVDEETYKFPVKWTAPEAIRTAVYTSKSDVWYVLCTISTSCFTSCFFYSLHFKLMTMRCSAILYYLFLFLLFAHALCSL
jgi:serine/threonine protein kinase